MKPNQSKVNTDMNLNSAKGWHYQNHQWQCQYQWQGNNWQQNQGWSSYANPMMRNTNHQPQQYPARYYAAPRPVPAPPAFGPAGPPAYTYTQKNAGPSRTGTNSKSIPKASEESDYAKKQRNLLETRIEAAKKDFEERIEVRNQVQKLKEKLEKRKRNEGSESKDDENADDGRPKTASNGEEVNAETNSTNADIDHSILGTQSADKTADAEKDARSAIAENNRFREPVMEIFDMPMTSNDYREVGLGQITSSSPTPTNDTPPVSSTVTTSTTSSAPPPPPPPPRPSTSKKRVANQPIEKSKPEKPKKKKAAKRLKDAHDKEKEATGMRKNYEQIAEKLKGAIRSKDKSWLCNLVHAKTSNASKRILLSKLIEDNHAHISKELAAIRFAKAGPSRDLTERLDNEVHDIIDFQHLPQELFVQIEEFVKKEIPEAVKITETETDDDIIEVPVPPKPAPDLVTIDEEPPIITPLTRLKSITEDESLLYDQLKLLENQRKEVCDKLEKLRKEREEIICQME